MALHLAVARRHQEAARRRDAAPARQRARHDPALRELRPRRGGVEGEHGQEARRRRRGSAEVVDDFRLRRCRLVTVRVRAELNLPRLRRGGARLGGGRAVLAAHDAVGAAALLRRPTPVPGQGLLKGLAVAHVREPVAIGQGDAQGHVVEGRAEAALAPPHLPLQHVHLEAEPAQRRRQQQVQFVAKAAPPPPHHLRDEVGGGEGVGAPQVDVEVLEGDGEVVRAVDGAQPVRIRRRTPVQPDARQVRVQRVAPKGLSLSPQQVASPRFGLALMLRARGALVKPA